MGWNPEGGQESPTGVGGTLEAPPPHLFPGREVPELSQLTLELFLASSSTDTLDFLIGRERPAGLAGGARGPSLPGVEKSLEKVVSLPSPPARESQPREMLVGIGRMNRSGQS